MRLISSLFILTTNVETGIMRKLSTCVQELLFRIWAQALATLIEILRGFIQPTTKQILG
jgi:hypothetical protein